MIKLTLIYKARNEMNSSYSKRIFQVGRKSHHNFDDLLLTGSNTIDIYEMLHCSLYKMTNLILMIKFLGIQVLQSRKNILFHQTSHVLLNLEKSSISKHSPSYVSMSKFIKFSKETYIPLVNQTLYEEVI